MKMSFVEWQIQSNTQCVATSGVASSKFGGRKPFDFKRATVFCLGHRLSKNKMTRHARNLGGPWPPWKAGYTHDCNCLLHSWQFSSLQGTVCSEWK